MPWEALAGFIRTLDPAFARSVKGVPAEEIQRVEREYRLHLPGVYRDFLEMMGMDSGEFSLFGFGQDESFDDLIAEMPDASYPLDRYFRISRAGDDAGFSASDYFIDLGRTDGDDAPIVRFEDTQDFTPEHVAEWRFTFGEWVTRQVFSFLVLDRAAARAMVVITRDDVAEGQFSKEAVMTLLGRANFEPALPSLPRVGCLRRGESGALVDVLAGGLAVEVILSAGERRDLEVVVDQLLVRYPNATVSNPDAPFGL
jgi:hypothetical protein